MKQKDIGTLGRWPRLAGIMLLMTMSVLNVSAQTGADSIIVISTPDSSIADTLPDTAIVVEASAPAEDSLGIFLYRANDSIGTALQPTPFSIEKKSSGILGGIAMSVGGSILGTAIGGIGGAIAGSTAANIDFSKQRLVISGHSSMITIKSSDVSAVHFRFYLPVNQTQMFQNVGSASDFICVRLEQKKKKRILPSRLTLSLFGSSTGNLQSTADDIVAATVTQIDDTTSDITFPDGLKPGEYCFLFSDALRNIMQSSHIFAFDFTVTNP